MASAIVSALEGTVTSRRVTMGFLAHGGMWGDITFMSVVTGLVFPYLTHNWLSVVLAVSLALAVTLLAHAQWAAAMRADRLTCHVFPNHKAGIWVTDISVAGWMHVVIMTILVTVIFLYAISPVPRNTVVVASLLLTAHVFLANVQPGWYCRAKLWTRKNFEPPLWAVALIWTVAAAKIQR